MTLSDSVSDKIFCLLSESSGFAFGFGGPVRNVYYFVFICSVGLCIGRALVKLVLTAVTFIIKRFFFGSLKKKKGGGGGGAKFGKSGET